MFEKFQKLTDTEMPNPQEDRKSAKRIGQYKISENAVYMPDGGYIVLKDVTGIESGSASTHVAGCCIGCVKVERIILSAGEKKFQLIFDSKKEIERALLLIDKENGDKA